LWLLDLVKGYTINGVYKYVIFSEGTGEEERFVDIWHKKVPLNVTLLVWHLFRSRLPTNDNLVTREIMLPIGFAGDCDSVETALHLFLHCPMFGGTWSPIKQGIGVSLVHPSCLVAHFIQFGHLCDFSKNVQSCLYLIWFAMVWVLWKERNNQIFNKDEPM